MRVVELMTPSVISVQANQTVGEARALMRAYHIEHLPVFAGSLPRGVVTQRDLGSGPRQESCLDDVLLDDLLCHGERAPRSAWVSPLTTEHEARALLEEWPQGCLLVWQGGGMALGIVTHSDLAAMPGEERRAELGQARGHPRATLGVSAWEATGDTQVVVRIEDLSATGARVTNSEAPIGLGDSVALEWTLPGDSEEILAAARVVRTSGDVHAVEFTLLCDAEVSRIKAFVRAGLAAHRH